MQATVIIPARLASTRFPRKMLAAATGRPLVQHVVDRVRACTLVREVVVAADDRAVAEALAPFGTRVVMTDPAHASGTDRIAAVARGLDDDLFVNVQGDEPEIEPATVDALISRMGETRRLMGTVVTPFAPGRDPADPNLVKCVMATDGTAIYFSRHAIPFCRDAADPSPAYFHHLGIYGYRRAFLLEFAAWPPTPLERAEKLEQLRAVEHGVRIDTITVRSAAAGIDTAQQYEAFVLRYSKMKEPQMNTNELR